MIDKDKPKKKSKSKAEPVEILPERIEQLVKDAPELKAILTSFSVTSSWDGVLPPPDVFNKYPPTVRKKIVGHAETQMKHRQKIEGKVIESNIKNARTGMKLAFWITLGMMIIGTVLILFDKDIAGFLSLFGGTGFQASNFLVQKWQENHQANKDIEEENNRQIKGK